MRHDKLHLTAHKVQKCNQCQGGVASYSGDAFYQGSCSFLRVKVRHFSSIFTASKPKFPLEAFIITSKLVIANSFTLAVHNL